ncbi:Golgi transport complex subunit 3 [Coemansia spiralis]|nr:Golgi transport complex subunit 3 [Coemansia spiralis]
MPAGLSSRATVIDDWEQAFAVSDICRAGVSQLQEVCAQYPARLLVQHGGSGARGGPAGGGATPKLHPQLQHLRGSPQLSARRNASLRNLASLAGGAGLRPRAESLDSGAARGASALGISVAADEDPDGDSGDDSTAADPVAGPIETTAQFLEWYGRAESQLMAGQDREAHVFAESLRERVGQCAEMLACIDGVERLLAGMEADYGRVCELTEGVKAACAQHQQRRDRLIGMSTELGALLEVYNALGPISQLLNSPGDRVCLDKDFLPALERTESAMAAIARHRDGRDSELYLMRFAQCRMRALSLIKLHALRVFKSLSAAVAGGAPQGSSLSRSTALDIRFRAAAVQLAPLLHALQKRAATAGTTERQVLADVQSAYVHLRRGWLRSHISDSLAAIAKEHEADADGDAGEARAGALRDWCAYMMNVCVDEHRLYYDFFDPQLDAVGGGVAMSAELRALLDSAMTVLHEQVRPLVIHEQGVAELAALSMVLLTYHRAAGDAAADAASDDGASLAADDDGLDAFYDVVGQMLQDAQQRLAYRAQAYIQSHIAGYRISKADAESLAQWARLCAQIGATDPAEFTALVAEAAKSTDLQGSGPASANATQPASRGSSSFVDLTTEAAPMAPATGDEAAPHSTVMARLVERMPGGRLLAADAESLQWIYPPVQRARWLVAQIDGCLAPAVHAGIAGEAQAACKQNLLSHGARHVRDKAAASGDAEQIAHLLVTYSLDLLAHALPDPLIQQ